MLCTHPHFLGRKALPELSRQAPWIAPSLLMCDFGNLEREVARLAAAGTVALHLDCMDGEFVPNFTYGMLICETLRRLSGMPLDVHLMIAKPERYVRHFAQAGADVITIHVEATEKPREVLQEIRSYGCGAGIALNPGTPLSQIESCLDVIDMALVMSVQPGFGGQKFDPGALDKIRTLRSRLAPEVLISVDGGVNESTITPCVEAGAGVLVVGSAIFAHDDYAARMSLLERIFRRE